MKYTVFLMLLLSGCTVFIGSPAIENLNQHGQYRSVSSLSGDALQEMNGGADVDAKGALQ